MSITKVAFSLPICSPSLDIGGMPGSVGASNASPSTFGLPTPLLATPGGAICRPVQFAGIRKNQNINPTRKAATTTRSTRFLSPTFFLDEKRSVEPVPIPPIPSGSVRAALYFSNGLEVKDGDIGERSDA